MTFPDDSQKIEQAFVESWVRIREFYITNHFWGTPEWCELTKIDYSEFVEMPAYVQAISGQQMRRPWFQELLDLIADMRKRGYDHKLRSGQSMDTLVLSRSLEHGLRSGQACLAIDIDMTGGMIISYIDESGIRTETTTSSFYFSAALEKFLTKILERPID